MYVNEWIVLFKSYKEEYDDIGRISDFWRVTKKLNRDMRSLANYRKVLYQIRKAQNLYTAENPPLVKLEVISRLTPWHDRSVCGWNAVQPQKDDMYRIVKVIKFIDMLISISITEAVVFVRVPISVGTFI